MEQIAVLDDELLALQAHLARNGLSYNPLMRRWWRRISGFAILAVALAAGYFRCSSPVPVSRDPRLVGFWVKATEDSPNLIHFREDGTGEAYLRADSLKERQNVIRWGTSDGIVWISRPRIDSGPYYERASYSVSSDLKSIALTSGQVLIKDGWSLEPGGGKVSILGRNLVKR